MIDVYILDNMINGNQFGCFSTFKDAKQASEYVSGLSVPYISLGRKNCVVTLDNMGFCSYAEYLLHKKYIVKSNNWISDGIIEKGYKFLIRQFVVKQ